MKVDVGRKEGDDLKRGCKLRDEVKELKVEIRVGRE